MSAGLFNSGLVLEMKNLQLSQSENEQEHLAGYIKSVIPPNGTVVIQQAQGSNILDVGTVIFAQKTNAHANDYEEIGYISDLFGSINEPMYALQLRQPVTSELLLLNSKVFYLCDHPSTRIITVICNETDHYSVMYT